MEQIETDVELIPCRSCNSEELIVCKCDDMFIIYCRYCAHLNQWDVAEWRGWTLEEAVDVWNGKLPQNKAWLGGHYSLYTWDLKIAKRELLEHIDSNLDLE